ncbi:MAG: DUF1801 domain-containing protein [Hyphomonadaceae bacterium]|mgnify:FL=1|nr:DUF1801 domain-containing protein [Hyphomonadaceae bacterium]MBP9233862.1 DUF1801 domain-containing protein [Hyphomonadaceae bacterium]
MAELKTKATNVSVEDFIAKVPNETRRADAQSMVNLFEKVSGWKAQMWGPTIIGFGRYSYTYDSGHSGDMCVLGFSPRSTNLVIYTGVDQVESASLLKALGKHKVSKACIYINKLADVDMTALEKLLKASLAATKKRSKEKGWPITAT